MVLPLVVQVAVDDYGSTQDADIIVPLTMTMDPTNSNNHPSPSKKKTTTTKWMVACILGLTAALMVLSSAVLFVSRRDTSVRRAATRTEDAFLLHPKDGTCVAASGGWPPGTETVTDAGTNSFLEDDANYFSCPYSTCFEWVGVESLQNDRCWSHSYVNGDGDWKPCKPKGYGSEGWTEYEDGVKLNECGPPCTEFEKT